MTGIYDDWAPQKTISIGRWRIGGLPGENPSWLVGSIFYMGDKLLRSEDGEIDKEGAQGILEEAGNTAAEHGLVLALDVVFPTVESVGKILPFIAEYDYPLLLDSPDPEARMKSYRMALELGVNDRSVANGLYTNSPPEEPRIIAESRLAAAILMAFNPMIPHASMKPQDRLRLLEEKLLPMAVEAGIENTLVDAVVIDPASIGLSGETVRLVKKERGLPAGCAPANALGSVSKKKVGVNRMYSIHGGVAAYLATMGGDFIMYGPVKRIKYVAEPVALVDSLLAYGLKWKGVRISRIHPLYKYLKNIQKLFVNQ